MRPAAVLLALLGCAAFAEWPSSKANQVVEMVHKLEDVSDIRTLTALCSK